MTDTFAALKKSRENSLDRLTKEIQKFSVKASNKSEDDRIWYPEVDKGGNGYAVIRFLPAPKGEDLPWVRIWSHGFKGPTGKWYIEKSLTTLSMTDPVSEYNSSLWNSTTDDSLPARKQAREQKRRLNYMSNILIIKDAAHPENEGKVFLYRYGKKIFDKINLLMNPEFEDEKQINPFDFWNGCNFKLKIRNVEGYRNYDKSEFDLSASISDDDVEIEKIWSSQYSLQEFISPDKFKGYDELKRKLNDVLGLANASNTNEVRMPVDVPRVGKVASAPKLSEKKVEPESDESDDLNFFKSLAEDDES